MFQYYVKQSQHAESKRNPVFSYWTRRYPHMSETCSTNRPLPPRPITYRGAPEHAAVPLRIWIIASGFCFITCAALVLATIIITRWDSQDPFAGKEMIDTVKSTLLSTTSLPSDYNTLLKQVESISTNPISDKENGPKTRENLISKSQIHPIHEDILHIQRNTKKKDKAIKKDDIQSDFESQKHVNKWNIENILSKDGLEAFSDSSNSLMDLPKFKPIAPFLSLTPELYATESTKENTITLKNTLSNEDFVPPSHSPKYNAKSTNLDKLPYGFDGKDDYFYNDDNFYEDYMQSNTMTSYLIEKVQEVHDWVTTDPDLNNNYTSSGKDFASLLKALNDSIIDGNLTIVMTKLRDMYFGDNYTNFNNSRKPIVTNNTDLLSFGILTLDAILLHNIQTMAWENQESAKLRMLRDPNVFAFNALFSDPSKLEQIQNNIGGSLLIRRLAARSEQLDDGDIPKSLFENILEAGMSTARAAIHLGKAYKNTKNMLQHSQLQNKTVPSLISRNLNSNSLALNHLQSTYDNNNVYNSSSGNNGSFSSNNGSFYTELDCIWLLYCRNLEATSKLSMPYGTMARINGIALRILTGELVPDHALDTITYEVLTGWTDLHCNDMFPRCSKANAASIVIESILQGHRKSSAKMKTR